jgi:hypothetical protein
MNKKYWMKFLDANDGGGGGGAGEPAVGSPTAGPIVGDLNDVFGGDEPAKGTGTGDNKPAAGDDKPAGGDKPAGAGTDAPPAAPTAEDIAKRVLDGMKPAGEPTKQYTPEELDKMFNVYKPNVDLIKAIREGDETAAVAAVHNMIEGVVKQVYTMIEYQNKILTADLEGKFTPALQSAQKLTAREAEEKFYNQHTDLKDYKEAVQTVFKAMKTEGANFKDAAEASKAIADRTRKLLGLTAPAANGANDGQPADGNTNQNGSGRPANLSGGSQASGGGGKAATGVRGDLQNIFL